MKIFSTSLFVTLLSLYSVNSFSQECSGEIVVPSLTCINAEAGPDVRLYIMEFQTCENGKITELDRSILGMNVLSQTDADDIHTIGIENVDITYSSQRILIDPEERVDFLSFLLPKEVKMIDGKNIIEMSITEELEPDYEGADTFHFKGAFKLLKENGKTATGRLACSVSR